MSEEYFIKTDSVRRSAVQCRAMHSARNVLSSYIRRSSFIKSKLSHISPEYNFTYLLLSSHSLLRSPPHRFYCTLSHPILDFLSHLFPSSSLHFFFTLLLNLSHSISSSPLFSSPPHYLLDFALILLTSISSVTFNPPFIA